MQLDTMRYSCGERYYKDGREIEAPEEYIQIVKMKINTDRPAVKLKKNSCHAEVCGQRSSSNC